MNWKMQYMLDIIEHLDKAAEAAKRRRACNEVPDNMTGTNKSANLNHVQQSAPYEADEDYII